MRASMTSRPGVLRLAALVLAGLASHALLGADTPMADPGIPNGETASYRVETGERRASFTERTWVEGDGSGQTYRIVYISETQTIETTLRRGTMIPVRVRTVAMRADRTLETVTTISLRTEPNTTGVLVLAFSDLKYSLRGYPFGSVGELDVVFLNASDDTDGVEFSIRVKYLGVQDRVVAGRKIPSHKLELVTTAGGFLRILSGLVPKTYYWYSVEAPHYLVAYEGSGGLPGSPKSYTEIVDYTGWR